jgi:hypothetical protein
MVVLWDVQFKYHRTIRIVTKEHMNCFIWGSVNEIVSTFGVGDASANEFNSDILRVREVDTDIVNKSVNNNED